MPLHPKRLSSYFLHPFLTVSLPIKVRWRLNCPLSLEKRCPFLTRSLVTLGELANEGVRIEARSPAFTQGLAQITSSPLIAKGETQTFLKTQSIATKEKEGLWSVTLPLGWDGITASAYEQPVIMDMRMGWLGALGSLTSIWFIDFSPGTLQLANNYLILWLTRLLLIAASLIWCSTSTATMEGFGGHTPPLTKRCMHTIKAGGCSIHAGNLSREPENKP